VVPVGPDVMEVSGGVVDHDEVLKRNPSPGGNQAARLNVK
jgi:hypothetical protein